MHRAGFEPAPPKREQLKCSALDRSAIGAYKIPYEAVYCHTSGLVRDKSLIIQLIIAVGIFEYSHINEELGIKSVHRAGFEPAPPKREQLKCSALDHSAIDAKEYSLRGSNPRPYD